ncbi:MAG TPA: di-heme oxidoredictase family protein [Alphaproteobacteria bacterium]|nr:di-heme oxidoredictase family protein [Alphaproteobacteria bacterium]
MRYATSLGIAFLAIALLPARAQDTMPREGDFAGLVARIGNDQPEKFLLGRTLFESDWSIAPGPKAGFDGLGPLFSRLSCDGCHTHAGRGEPPQSPDFPMISMTVRLSIPGTTPEGGPRPHPLYGDQLDRNAVAGVPIEGRASVSYTENEERYADGTAYSLRAPHYRFEALAYGPLGSDTLVSVRIAPAIVGLGLIDAVPDQEIEAIASEEKRNGRVHGRPNRVWDLTAEALRVGHLGWKAGQPSLRQQNANAFNRDIGITNPLYPTNDCTEVETECQAAAAASPRKPKIGDEFLDAATFYVAQLAPSLPREQDSPIVKQGAVLFEQAGCAECHRPTLESGTSPDPDLAHREFHPYSDLLLHDMGDGLADGRPEFVADGRSWRTAPLWGLGLIKSITGHEFLLHDGRARGPAEAILWHGGEAEAAKDAFRGMTKDERDALIAFLESL